MAADTLDDEQTLKDLRKLTATTKLRTVKITWH